MCVYCTRYDIISHACVFIVHVMISVVTRVCLLSVVTRVCLLSVVTRVCLLSIFTLLSSFAIERFVGAQKCEIVRH